MQFKKKLKKIGRFWIHNYFILILFACVAFVGLVFCYQFFNSKSAPVYVKIKVGQGMWWFTAQKPNIWFVNAISNLKEKEPQGKNNLVQIVGVEYYPVPPQPLLPDNDSNNQYEVYVSAKIQVTPLGKTGKYSFNRSTIGIASAIDFEFPKVQFSGTIIQLDNKPFVSSFEEKTIYLVKNNPLPWEYDSILVGDKYFDGENETFEILDKSLKETALNIKAKIKLKKIGQQYVYGEEQTVLPGKEIFLITNRSVLNNFHIAKIE